MTISNPGGSDTFSSISGTHLSGRGNSDVVSLLGVNGTTTNFPRIICNQFRFLTTISFRSLGVTELTPNSFVDCTRLEFIDLGERNIFNSLLIRSKEMLGLILR